MFGFVGAIVFLAVGLGVWRAIVFLNSLYEEHVPDNLQDRIYKTSKDFPKIVWAWFIGLVFWASAGAVLLRFILGLIGAEKVLPSTAWAPGIFFPLLMAIVFHFWESPHRTKNSFKSRGRQISKSLDQVNKNNVNTSTTAKRGRTIRSYRDIQ